MARVDDIVAAFAPEAETWRKFLADRSGVTVKAPREIRLADHLGVQWEFDTPAKPKDTQTPCYFVRIAFDPDQGAYKLHAGFRDGTGEVKRQTVLDDVFLNTLDEPATILSWVGRQSEEYAPGEVDGILDELDEILGARSGSAC